MKYFVEILKQFTMKQRLIVLVLLLSFTTGGVLLSQYFKTDDCRPIIQENFKMQEDFAKISQMLREERLKFNTVMVDTMAAESSPTGGSVQNVENSYEVMDSILIIAESHEK